MAVETTADGLAPDAPMLPQTGVYTGSSDHPAPPVEHRYIREPGSDNPVIYRYRPR